jgi:hypothetical protein
VAALPQAPSGAVPERPEYLPEVPTRPTPTPGASGVIGTPSELAKLTLKNPKEKLPPAPPSTEDLPPIRVALSHPGTPPSVPGAAGSAIDNLPQPIPARAHLLVAMLPDPVAPATRPEAASATSPATTSGSNGSPAALPALIVPRQPVAEKAVTEPPLASVPPGAIVLQKPDAPPGPVPPILDPSSVVINRQNVLAPDSPRPLPLNARPLETAEPPGRIVPFALPKGLQPVSTGQPGAAAGSMRNLYNLAQESYNSIDSYIVRFRRRELVGARMGPEEIMLLKFRKQPWSVYFKWLGNEGKGREVVYVKGRYGNLIHTKTAAGDVPFMPGGKRMSVAPDSMLVRSKSRHPITEAGIGTVIAQLGGLVELAEHADPRLGGAKYLGLVRRKEFADPVEAVLHVIPAGMEQGLPRGGRRFYYFDTKMRFPVLIITLDENQQEVEYYCYDRFLFPGRLSDDDFNPDILWRPR